MPKNGGAIIGTIVALFCLVLATMVGAAAIAQDDSAPKESCAGTLHKVDQQGLSTTGISPADLFGEEWVAGTFVCPGVTEQELLASGLNPADFNLVNEEIDKHDNYLLLAKETGEYHVEKMSIHNVNLCTIPLQGPFQTQAIIHLEQDEEGTWNFIG